MKAQLQLQLQLQRQVQMVPGKGKGVRSCMLMDRWNHHTRHHTAFSLLTDLCGHGAWSTCPVHFCVVLLISLCCLPSSYFPTILYLLFCRILCYLILSCSIFSYIFSFHVIFILSRLVHPILFNGSDNIQNVNNLNLSNTIMMIYRQMKSITMTWKSHQRQLQIKYCVHP